MNRVIDAVELEGLEKVAIHNHSFAPFESFGAGFHGDGEDRNFGDPVHPDNALHEGYRIGSKVTLDLATGSLIEKRPLGSWSLFWDPPTFSPAQFEQFTLNYDGNTYVSYHYSGSNAEILLPAPDIDVKIRLEFLPSENSENSFRVWGYVKGDRFPSNETYLTDEGGNRLFLGVSGPDAGEFGPYTKLFGDGERRMQRFDFNIQFKEEDGKKLFDSVILHDGTEYSLDQWNSKFTDLDSQNIEVGTRVNRSEIETNYD